MFFVSLVVEFPLKFQFVFVDNVDSDVSESPLVFVGLRIGGFLVWLVSVGIVEILILEFVHQNIDVTIIPLAHDVVNEVL